jgi:hypothetical protein
VVAWHLPSHDLRVRRCDCGRKVQGVVGADEKRG